MPKRRTGDVGHVGMTDHYIQRRKPARDLLAPLAEKMETDDNSYRGPVVLYYPPNLPDGAQQEDVLRWLSWNSEHFSRHAGTLYFNYIIKPALGLGAPDDAAVKEATGFVRRFGAVLNDHLRGRKYLLGDTLTIADFATAITLPYAARAKIPVDEFPEIVRWHARLNELPAWREPFPKRQTQAA